MTEETKSVFVEWAEITTAHGVVDFVKARSCCGKIVWALLLFVSLTLMTYQIVRTSIAFSQHTWSTTIQELLPAFIPFPSIIVCNANRLKYSKAKEYGMTDDMITYMFLNLRKAPDDVVISDLDFSAESAFIAWRKARNLTYITIFDKIAPSCEDIFIGDVCEKFLVLPIDTVEYGRCYRVELNETGTTVGSTGGHTFLLNVQSSDYLPIIENNILVEGMVLQIVYNGRVEVGQWIKLLPGTMTSVGMQVSTNTLREEKKTILDPFSYLASEPPCKRAPKMVFFNDSQYSIMNCYLECSLMVNVKLCNCVPYLQISSYRTCEVEEILNCSGIDRNLEPVNGTASFGESGCFESCEIPCYDRTIETQISVTKFPSQRQRNALQASLNAKNSNQVQIDDVILLEVYFSSLQIMETEMYEDMNMEDFISACGGVIGIYVGMSFLTIFQAIDYILKCWRLRKEKRKRKNAIKPDILEIRKSVSRGESDFVEKPSIY